MSKNFSQMTEWVKRFEKRFDTLDINNDGYLTIKEILTWPDRLREACQASPEDVEPFRQSLLRFWEIIGLVPGKKLTKSELVQGSCRLAEADLRRKQKGEETYYENVHNALFDVTDVNKDGTLSLDEVKIMMKTLTGMDQPGAAEALFNMADKNHNGKVERKELIELKFNFWFNPEDTTGKGLFGGAFE